MRRLFIISAVIILLLTSVSKLASVGSASAVLDERNPVVDLLTNRQLLGLAGCVELLVAGMVMIMKDPLLRQSFVLWIASVFLVYRMGLWHLGYGSTCFCLGVASQWVPLSMYSQDIMMRGLLAYLLVGSVLSLAWEISRTKNATHVQPGTTGKRDCL